MQSIATAAAGIWLGGLIVIAIVAQTTFSVTRTTGIKRPNAVAGQIMAKNFSRFDTVQLVCAATLLTWQLGALAVGRRSRRDLIRTTLIVLLTACMIVSVFVMTPTLAERQSHISDQISEESIRESFAAYHQTAVRISQATMALLLVILLELTWTPKLRSPA